jgi:hypothetical protein
MPTSQQIQESENHRIITHGFHQPVPAQPAPTPIVSKPRDNTNRNQVPYIELTYQLEVTPTRKVLVPGCEPTSALSSTKLSSWLAETGCGNALVDLDAALEEIPGSYVKIGNNFGRGNMRQKWFVLPGIDLNCPCQSYDDYYQILRDLAGEEEENVETFDSCDVVGMGYCPSPDFDQTLPPPPDPYQEEGEFPGDVGVLPPIPPWSQAGT